MNSSDVFILISILIFLAIMIFVLMRLGLLRWSQLTSFIGGRDNTRRSDQVKDLAKHPRTKSEARAIDILEKITGGKFPTVNPAWLIVDGKTLELDGYNAELKLALEFSGPLHTKWFPAKEPYERYYRRVILDQAKKDICAEYGVGLIVIDMRIPGHHLRDYIMSRLYDFGREPMPVNYIPAQDAEPFRNPSLERELGLTG